MTTQKLTNKQKKEWAKMLYMKELMTYQDIAAKVGASRVTVSGWARREKWEMLRAADTTTREELRRNLYIQMAEIQKAIAARDSKYATPAEADTIAKLSGAIAKLEGDCTTASIISVGKRFLTYVKNQKPEAVGEIAQLYDGFVKQSLDA